MIIALHDADFKQFKKYKTFPNYALTKISAYHKSQGDAVEWWNEGVIDILAAKVMLTKDIEL